MPVTNGNICIEEIPLDGDGEDDDDDDDDDDNDDDDDKDDDDNGDDDDEDEPCGWLRPLLAFHHPSKYCSHLNLKFKFLILT